jgi:hypothetical protein
MSRTPRECVLDDLLRRERAMEDIRGFRVAVWLSGTPIVGTFDEHNQTIISLRTTGDRKIFVRYDTIQAIEL